MAPSLELLHPLGAQLPRRFCLRDSRQELEVVLEAADDVRVEVEDRGGRPPAPPGLLLPLEEEGPHSLPEGRPGPGALSIRPRELRLQRLS